MTSTSTVKRGGRPKGSVNHSTAKARAAIATFVNETAPHMREWLAQAAYGIPKVDANGEVIRDTQGSVVWVNRPDPLGAIKAVANVLEFHLPRINRSELDIVDRSVLPLEQMSTDELRHRLMVQMGIEIGEDATLIDQKPEET